MSIKFDMARDVNGYNGFGLNFSPDVYSTTLAVGVEQTLNVPTGGFKKWIAIFGIEPGAEAWVAINQTAALPGAAFAVSAAEMNPVARVVQSGDVLHFICPNADTRVSVSFYGRDGIGRK
jgi:hypothetical protein